MPSISKQLSRDVPPSAPPDLEPRPLPSPWTVLLATGARCAPAHESRPWAVRPSVAASRPRPGRAGLPGSPVERTLLVVSRRRPVRQSDVAALPADNLLVEPVDRGTAMALLLPLLELCRRLQGDAVVVVQPWDPSSSVTLPQRELRRLSVLAEHEPTEIGVLTANGVELAAVGRVRSFLGLYKDRMAPTLGRFIRSWMDRDLPLEYPSFSPVDLFRDVLADDTRRVRRAVLPPPHFVSSRPPLRRSA